MSPRRSLITLPAEPLRDGPTTLRRWQETDVEALAALARDPEIVRWIGLSPEYGIDDARAYLAVREEAARAGVAAHFAVTASDDGTLLGSISLLRFSWPNRRGEVGYWLGPAARGLGHATRATRLICRWGFRALGLERIALLAAAANPASQAVARRAGFTREALLRSFSAGPEGREDMICFGLLASDPPA